MVAPALDWTDIGIASGKFHPVSGIPTQLGVLHSAECPLAIGYARSLTSWAGVPLAQGGPEASWQRFVDPSVRLRFIPDDLGAWHASEANPLSIGWEQAGYARYTRAEWTTALGLVQLDNLAYDMAEVAVRDGLDARWLSTAEVRAVLDDGNRLIKGFCTHRQIDPETRTDPGDGYPYDLLMTRIRFYVNGGTAAPTKPKVKDMPKTIPVRVDMEAPRRLAKGLAWTASPENDGHPFTNLAAGGVGAYDVQFFVEGTGLPTGKKVVIQFWLEDKQGKQSGHFRQAAHGSEDGTWEGAAVFGMGIRSGDRLYAKMTSTVDTAYVTNYGADLKVWA